MCSRARIVTYVSFIWLQANSTFWHIDINTKILTIKWANYIICNHHIMIALQHLFHLFFYETDPGINFDFIKCLYKIKCYDTLWCSEVKGPEKLLLAGAPAPSNYMILFNYSTSNSLLQWHSRYLFRPALFPQSNLGRDRVEK